MSVKGSAKYSYGADGQYGTVYIVADDSSAPTDKDLFGVRDDLKALVSTGVSTSQFKSGRVTVTIASSRGGGTAAMRAALAELQERLDKAKGSRRVAPKE